MLVGALVLLAGFAYYRIDLFNEYAAGFASVEPQPDIDQGLRTRPCDNALADAYGPASPTQARGDQESAFYQGCLEKRSGMPYSPWTLAGYLRADD